MHRRSVFWLLATVPFAATSLAGCQPAASSPPAPAASSNAPVPPSPSKPATPADYRWLTAGDAFAKGFSFLWVSGLTSQEVLLRLGAKELERVFWHQLIGPGDGQRGDLDRRFFGVGRADDNWVLIVEENGTLGMADELLDRLSAGTTVISHYRGTAHAERLLVLSDGATDLTLNPQTGIRTGGRATELSPLITSSGIGAARDSRTRTAAAFVLTERLTGIAMTRELLESKTYLLSTTTQE